MDAPVASTSSGNTKEWTDEERQALENKLDEDLDKFISGFKKREISLPPFEEMAEELQKHPFFLKDMPQDGSLHPLVEGLQNLKYSADENTTEELALAHKDDGNQAFKVANYRLAVMSYTEGINKKCANNKINATLYNNRAAAHFRLKNYRSCYNDCKTALEFDPTYAKAIMRLVDACMELELYDECVKYCKELEDAGHSQQFRDVAQKAIKKKNEKARNERRKIFHEKKKELGLSMLEKTITERGIRMANSNLANLESPLLGDHVPGVHLQDGKLVWPVVLLYPEHSMTEVIQNFHEDSTFESQLAEVFEERPEWDSEGKYQLGTVNVYYEGDGSHHKVDMQSTLRAVITQKSYTVEAATPAFIIYAKGSDAERNFLR